MDPRERIKLDMKDKIIYSLIAIVTLVSCGEIKNKDSGEKDSLATKEFVPATDSIALFTETPRDEEEIRKMYRHTVTLIDNNELLDTSSFSYNCQGEKKGIVTYYTLDGAVRLIEHQYNEYDHYDAVDQYYVQNDSVYFAFLKGTAWSFESGDGATKDNVTEKRVYLAKGKPIKCLEKKYTIYSQFPQDTNSIANIEVDCPPVKSIVAPYRLLKKHYKNPTTGCLE